MAGEDYKHFRENVTFAKNEELRQVYIEIIDDFEWEPYEFFFVKLHVDKHEVNVALGNVGITQVTIVNEDGKLCFTFKKMYMNK
jgi:hypothetical protein